MKGKILGAGAISGEDGVRYYYDEKELKNLKEGQKLEGCEVDFDIKDGKAVGVYIIKGGGFNADFSKVGANVSASLEKVNLPKFDSKHIFWDLNEAKANLLRPNMHSIKFWLLVVAILSLFVSLDITPSTGSSDFSNVLFWLFGIASTDLLLWISFCISTLVNSYTLLKFNAIALVFSLILIWLADEIIKGYIMGVTLGTGHPYFKIFLAIIFTFVAFVYNLKWLKLLSQITEQKAYMWAFYVAVALIVFKFGVMGLGYQINEPHMFEFGEALTSYIYIVFAVIFAWATLRFRIIKKVA